MNSEGTQLYIYMYHSPPNPPAIQTTGNNEQWSVCYTIGPLNIEVCTQPSQIP